MGGGGGGRGKAEDDSIIPHWRTLIIYWVSLNVSALSTSGFFRCQGHIWSMAVFGMDLNSLFARDKIVSNSVNTDFCSLLCLMYILDGTHVFGSFFLSFDFTMIFELWAVFLTKISGFSVPGTTYNCFVFYLPTYTTLHYTIHLHLHYLHYFVRDEWYVYIC